MRWHRMMARAGQAVLLRDLAAKAATVVPVDLMTWAVRVDPAGRVDLESWADREWAPALGVLVQ